MIVFAYYPLSGELIVRWILELACKIDVSIYPDMSGQVVFCHDLPFGFDGPVIYMVRHPLEIARVQKVKYTKHRKKRVQQVLTQVDGWSEHVLAWHEQADLILEHQAMRADLYHVVETFQKFMPELEVVCPDKMPRLSTKAPHLVAPPQFKGQSGINKHWGKIEERWMPIISLKANIWQRHHKGLKRLGWL